MLACAQLSFSTLLRTVQEPMLRACRGNGVARSGLGHPIHIPQANPKWTFETLFPGDSKFCQLTKLTLAIVLFH